MLLLSLSCQPLVVLLSKQQAVGVPHCRQVVATLHYHFVLAAMFFILQPGLIRHPVHTCGMFLKGPLHIIMLVEEFIPLRALMFDRET